MSISAWNKNRGPFLQNWETLNINNAMKSINGNHRSLKISSYNLGRGLLDSENCGTFKLTEKKRPYYVKERTFFA